MNVNEIPKLVINLPERTDRLEQVKKELAGIDYQIVQGVINQSPMLGIAQAHVNCSMIAKANEWPRVLIMEDDVVLRNGAFDYLNTALENLPHDWDILLGGLYETKGLTKYNEYWNRVDEFCGLHFYIVNSKFYDKIIAYPGSAHIDRWMNYRGDKCKVYVTSKLIATQSDGFSDNVKKKVNYEDKIKRFSLL
jgi:GR25 family glycosyltransferase involved in LPS biosynthesis